MKLALNSKALTKALAAVLFAIMIDGCTSNLSPSVFPLAMIKEVGESLDARMKLRMRTLLGDSTDVLLIDVSEDDCIRFAVGFPRPSSAKESGGAHPALPCMQGSVLPPELVLHLIKQIDDDVAANPKAILVDASLPADTNTRRLFNDYLMKRSTQSSIVMALPYRLPRYPEDNFRGRVFKEELLCGELVCPKREAKNATTPNLLYAHVLLTNDSDSTFYQPINEVVGPTEIDFCDSLDDEHVAGNTEGIVCRRRSICVDNAVSVIHRLTLSAQPDSFSSVTENGGCGVSRNLPIRFTIPSVSLENNAAQRFARAYLEFESGVNEPSLDTSFNTKFDPRVIIIGSTSHSAGDYHTTPIGQLSGAEILANGILTALPAATRTNTSSGWPHWWLARAFVIYLVTFLAMYWCWARIERTHLRLRNEKPAFYRLREPLVTARWLLVTFTILGILLILYSVTVSRWGYELTDILTPLITFFVVGLVDLGAVFTAFFERLISRYPQR